MCHGYIDRKKDKGFGFIRNNETGDPTFFHVSGLTDLRWEEVEEGDQVSYTEETQPDGRTRAVNVQRVRRATPASGATTPSDAAHGYGPARDDETTYNWDAAS